MLLCSVHYRIIMLATMNKPQRVTLNNGEQIVNGKNALGADIASMLFAEFPAALSKIRRYLLGPGEFYRKALADLKARTPEGTDLEFKTLEWLYLFYSHYMNELEKRNLLDFDEILIRSKNLVKDMREGGVLPERRIFLIDEFAGTPINF